MKFHRVKTIRTRIEYLRNNNFNNRSITSEELELLKLVSELLNEVRVEYPPDESSLNAGLLLSLRTVGKIDSIKWLRQKTDMSLREAMNTVNKLLESQPRKLLEPPKKLIPSRIDLGNGLSFDNSSQKTGKKTKGKKKKKKERTKLRLRDRIPPKSKRKKKTSQ